MKILQVVHQFLPRYRGGTEHYVADLSRSLRERGHQVALFAGDNEAHQSTWEGLDLITTPGGQRGPQGPVGTFFATFGNRQTEEAFLNTLRHFRPSVVHFHHLLGLSTRLPLLAKRLSIPTCYTLHDYWFVCPKSQLINHAGEVCQGPVAGLNCGVCAAQRLGNLAFAAGAPIVAPLFALRERLVRQRLGGVDMLLAPSRFLADFAVRKGLPHDKITLVDFGIASQEGRAAPWRSRPPGAPLRVTYLGAIDWSKGVHVLVEACHTLGQGTVEVRVYGDLTIDMDYSERLQRQAQGLPIHFEGHAPREAIPGILAATDVLVVPSLWYENSPLVLSEAFAAGVPVVASRIGALAEKIRDGRDGLLFAKGDASDLAQVLQRLAQEPDLLAKLRAQVRGEKTRDQHISHMERVYEALVARYSSLEQVR